MLVENLRPIVTTTLSGSPNSKNKSCQNLKSWQCIRSERRTSVPVGTVFFFFSFFPPCSLFVSHKLTSDPNARGIFLQDTAADDWPPYDKIREGGFDRLPDNPLHQLFNLFFFLPFRLVFFSTLQSPKNGSSGAVCPSSIKRLLLKWVDSAPTWRRALSDWSAQVAWSGTNHYSTSDLIWFKIQETV